MKFLTKEMQADMARQMTFKARDIDMSVYNALDGTMERDFVVFAKILRKVFPDATKGNGNDWTWKDINTVGENKNKVLSLMLNYKELEPTLFASWDFSSDARRLQVRLASQISNMRKTFSNCA